MYIYSLIYFIDILIVYNNIYDYEKMYYVCISMVLVCGSVQNIVLCCDVFLFNYMKKFLADFPVNIHINNNELS
jgi:hypothetical protein